MSEKEEYQINEGHYLEVMDRLHVITSNIESHLVNHILVSRLGDTELTELLHKTVTSLYDAYQRVGILDMEHNHKEDETNLE